MEKISLIPSTYDQIIKTIAVIMSMNISGENFEDKTDAQQTVWLNRAKIMVDSIFEKTELD